MNHIGVEYYRRRHSDPLFPRTKDCVRVKASERRRSDLSSRGDNHDDLPTLLPSRSLWQLVFTYEVVAGNANLEEVADLPRFLEIMAKVVDSYNFEKLDDPEFEGLFLVGCALINRWMGNGTEELIQFVLALFEALCAELKERKNLGPLNSEMICLYRAVKPELAKIKSILKYRIPERLKKCFNEVKDKTEFKQIKAAQALSVILPVVIEEGNLSGLKWIPYQTLVNHAVSLHNHINLGGKELEGIFEFSLTLLEVLDDDLKKRIDEPNSLFPKVGSILCHSCIQQSLRM